MVTGSSNSLKQRKISFEITDTGGAEKDTRKSQKILEHKKRGDDMTHLPTFEECKVEFTDQSQMAHARARLRALHLQSLVDSRPTNADNEVAIPTGKIRCLEFPQSYYDSENNNEFLKAHGWRKQLRGGKYLIR